MNNFFFNEHLCTEFSGDALRSKKWSHLELFQTMTWYECAFCRRDSNLTLKRQTQPEGLGFQCIFENLWRLRVKVTIPSNMFAVATSTYSCLQCTPFVHVSLGSILGTSISNALKIHILFVWNPKNAFWENLKPPFYSSKNPIIN